MIENVIDTTENCRHSLMCRHVCPVGNLTHRETLTPHGWAQLVASERRGLISWDEESVEAMYACADCGNCRSHCVTSQPLPAAIAAVRAQFVQQELAPDAVYELGARFRQWENPYESRKPEASTGKSDVALFVGDETAYLRPRMLEAALRLLAFLGIEPALIGRGRSNGYLPNSLGLQDVARDVARRNFAELEATGATRLVVLAPGDFFTLGRLYDERLGIEMPGSVELVELTTLLDAELEPASSASTDGERRHAYVDPTHAARVPTHYDPARRLVDRVRPKAQRVELFWRRNRAYPCGNIGLEFTWPRLAEQLTNARLEDAVSVGASTVVTSDAGSLHHLERLADAHGLKVEGLFELLVEQFDA